MIVLAAGAIESPRLWLNSRLPNPNGWVGRGMTNHFEDLVAGLMPFDTSLTKGPTSAARADFPGRGSVQLVGAPAADSAGLLAVGTLPGRRGESVTRGRSNGRLVGSELTDFLARIDHVLSIIILTDDDVDRRNRVSLSNALVPDAHGRVPRIDVPLAGRTARSIRNREFLLRQAAAILERAGAVAIHQIDSPPVLGHIHSTLRMGLDPADSVLDPHGEARWVRRLFVAYNSALSNSLGGPNPTLTTQALATRLAERIFQRYFGGTPWVTKESPTTSTDDRVTVAVRQRGL